MATVLAILEKKSPVELPSEPVVKQSILSDAVSFAGDLKTKGALFIDGEAKGTIEAESVTVGKSGSLEGTVRCAKLHIKGRFDGSGACEELIIAEEAQVATRSLTYNTIVVQRGARVVGDLNLAGSE